MQFFNPKATVIRCIYDLSSEVIHSITIPRYNDKTFFLSIGLKKNRKVVLRDFQTLKRIYRTFELHS